MMNFLRKHRNTIFLITIIGFLAGAFVGFGSYFFGNKTPADAVAEVNDTKIQYRDFISLYNRIIENSRKQKDVEINDEFMARKKQEALQDIIQEEVFYQQAQKYGIIVTNGELAADISHYPAFQRDGKFDQGLYFQMLREVIRETPKKFEESRKRQIAIYKLRLLIASSVAISEPELRLEFARANKGNMAAFEKERDKFLETVRQQKTSMIFNEWFKQLNQSTKIKVHLSEIEKQ
jgi:peptidyl-prolyl cis-trans isomerase D